MADSARTSQLVIETVMHVPIASSAKISQATIEVLAESPAPNAQVSQLVIETVMREGFTTTKYPIARTAIGIEPVLDC